MVAQRLYLKMQQSKGIYHYYDTKLLFGIV